MPACPLATAFLGAARWPDARPDAALEQALVERATAAAAAWPELGQPDERWAAYVGARAPDARDAMTALAAMRTADLWAACACAARDERAIAAVRARCLGDLAGALRHVDPSAALADEIHSELLAQLFVAPPGELPRITNYSGRGELRSWLRSAAIRTALKRLGGGRVLVADDALVDVLAAPATDPVLAQLRAEYREAVRTAFQEAFAELTARDRNLLRQHYLDQLSVDQLGVAYGVHRATAARWLVSVRDALLAGTRGRLADQLGLASAEIDSILFAIHSELDVSFARLVAD